jgi:hypothetical protein
MKEFTFKKSWLIKAQKKLPDYCIAELIVLVVEYGLSNKHEKVNHDCIIPLLEEIKSEIDSQRAKPPKKEKMRIPPTIKEVCQYVKDKNLDVDPEQWWNFYNAKGWFIGKNIMKNWHSAIATWVKRNQVQYGTGKQSDINSKIADIFTD